jgi:zinc D-Ala-D-Ala carboxypeptidase
MTSINTDELKKGLVKDWSIYAPYFKESEFVCSHTGLCFIQETFMQKLLALRLHYNHPMVITSGYRHPSHPIEERKSKAGKPVGYHCYGIAADVRCWSNQAHEIVDHAMKLKFRGIGVSQSSKSSARFIHLDDRPITDQKALYSY